MHRLQLSEMDPWNQRQPLPPPPSVNPFIIQQLLELQANTMPWCEGFSGLPFCACSVCQGMAQHHHHQYQAPSSAGPSRNQRSKGSRKAEALYHYSFIHESSATITGDRSTGIHPGYARIGANDNTGAEKVRRTPSRNPLMADHNSTHRCGRNHITGIVLAVPGRGVPTRWTPRCTRSAFWNQKVCWFRYPSFIDHFINNSLQEVRRQVVQISQRPHQPCCQHGQLHQHTQRVLEVRGIQIHKNVRAISWLYGNHR
jgi:hypothetical protein